MLNIGITEVTMANSVLTKAKIQKIDEFYTQLPILKKIQKP
jgi:hypothetical protein